MVLNFYSRNRSLKECFGVAALIATCLPLSFVIIRSFIVPKNNDMPETKAVVCSIQAKEEPYIDEFVDYHLAIGFRKIYIYDNSENFDLKKWGKQRYWDNVRVKHFPGEAKAYEAYFDCAKWAEKDGETWAAFLDLDEFLYLKKHDNIKDFLLEYGPSKGAIGINIMIVGTSNKTKYEPKPTVENAVGNIHIKSIARVTGLCPFPSPHFVCFIDKNTTTIDTDGNTIQGPFNKKGPTDTAVLYHYQDIGMMQRLKIYLNKFIINKFILV